MKAGEVYRCRSDDRFYLITMVRERTQTAFVTVIQYNQLDREWQEDLSYYHPGEPQYIDCWMEIRHLQEKSQRLA